MMRQNSKNIDPKTGEAYRLIQGVKLSKYSPPITIKPQSAQIYELADYIDEDLKDFDIPRFGRRRA